MLTITTYIRHGIILQVDPETFSDVCGQESAGINGLQTTLYVGYNQFTWWWFQIFFYFHPYLGKIPILTNYFSTGLKQPTRFTNH